MKKIISAILALVMCVSMMGGAAAITPDATGAYTYMLGGNATGADGYVNTKATDGSYDSANYLGAERVRDFGTWGWRYLDVNNDAYQYITRAMQVNAKNLRFRRKYLGGQDLSVDPAWELTAVAGAIELEPPEEGFYELSLATSKDTYTVGVGPRIEENKAVENYLYSYNVGEITRTAAELASTKCLVYSDGETPIVFALQYSGQNNNIDLTQIKLEKITTTGNPLFSNVTDNALTIEKGKNHRVVTVKDDKVVLPSFISYSSANKNVADVNQYGRITAKNGGVTTVTVSVGDWSQDITVTVPEDPELKTAFTIDDTDDIEAAVYVNKVSALAYVDGTESTEGVTATATQLSTGAYNMTTTTTNDEHTFLYWVKGLDGGAKKVVSREESFVYTPAGNGANYLIAVYEKDGATKDKAEFYDANGLLIKAIEGTTVITPDLPSMAGYGDAQKWVNKNGDKYADNTNVDISGTVMFIAEYAEPGADIIVTPLNNSCTVNEDKYAYGEKVICTPTATENFKAWVKDGEIVSVDAEKYEFYAWENCDVEAIYEAHTPLSGVARKIFIDLFGNNIMAEYIGFGDAVEKGIILDNTEIAMTSTNTQFTIALDDATSAKGYAVVKNSDGTYTKYIDGSYTKSAE